MIKQFCDLCDKEIIDEDYVERSILIHFRPIEQSGTTQICKECWENEREVLEGKK